MQTARLTIFVLAVAHLTTVIGCTDVRRLEGQWQGQQVGIDEVLRVGFGQGETAQLEVETADLDRFRATLTINSDLIAGASIQELASAEADILGEITFNTGQPSRVFVTLVPTVDGNGDAMGFFSLHGEDRIELRIVRGGQTPLYGIFFFSRT